MAPVTREHVPVLTWLLTLVSLALVLSAAGGFIPQTVVPAAPVWILDTIPLLNAIISLVAIGTITLGWYWIRQGMVDRHRIAMLVSVALFATFLVLYLYRLVVIGGASSFTGPDVVYRYVYLPVLVVHMGLAMVCIPLLYYVLLLAATHPVGTLSRTRHPTVGRIAASLWITSFVLGVVVYALLHLVY